MKTFILLPAFALAASSFATAAMAAPPATNEASAAVNYADLDLNTKAGRAKLKRRLAWAATRVCASDAWRGSPYLIPSCYHVTLNEALQQMERAIARANSRATLVASAPDVPRR